MTIERERRLAEIIYIQAVPGENLHKTSWDKSVEETG
jgi:hypothetical protein